MESIMEMQNTQDFCDAAYCVDVEERRKNKPTRGDYIETATLLRDFCVKTKVPRFETRAALYHWRRKIIMGAL